MAGNELSLLTSSSILTPVQYLHLAPSGRSNDSFFVPLIQDAATWDGTLCLQLQQYPIPWVFKTELGDNLVGNEMDDGAPMGGHDRSTIASIEMSEDVLNEILCLFRSMKNQQRRLRITLQKCYLQNGSTILPRLFRGAAPILERVETDHPDILELLQGSLLLPAVAQNQSVDPTKNPSHSIGQNRLPPLTRMPCFLNTLAMQISDPAHAMSLGTILKNHSCPLKRLHLYFGCEKEDSEKEENETRDSENDILVHPTFMDGLEQNTSIQTLRLSGHHIQRLLLKLSPSLQSHPNMGRLEVEDTGGQFLLGKDIGLSSILASPHSKITHCSIHYPKGIQQEVVSSTTKMKSSCSDFGCFFPIKVDGKTFQAESLTHLLIHARLNATMVDDLLVNLANFCPHLEELDLEDNDLESLCFRKFLDRPMNQRLVRLERLYLGSNLFQYKKETKGVEKLFEALPRVDIGNRGLSCGGTWDSDYNMPTLFMSWSHVSQRARAYKDWNILGRYLILLQQPYLSRLWPRAFAQVSKRFSRQNHESLMRQASAIYQFLRSGVIPVQSNH